MKKYPSGAGPQWTGKPWEIRTIPIDITSDKVIRNLAHAASMAAW